MHELEEPRVQKIGITFCVNEWGQHIDVGWTQIFGLAITIDTK